jgi:hypothetical protein
MEVGSDRLIMAELQLALLNFSADLESVESHRLRAIE